MTTHCESVKQRLRERFDAGEPLTGDFDGHVAACEGCRAYVARLRKLEQSFAVLPVATSAPDLALRIQDRLQTEFDGALQTRSYVAALLAAGVAAAAVLGWFFPLTADFGAIIGAVQFQPAAWDWSSALLSAQTDLRLAWENGLTQLSALAGLPTVALWTGLAVSILALAVFNTLEAASIRSHTNGSRGGYRTARR
ncbi:MAG: hypothetical protein HZB26_09735 [Candidatus Hydrogenedentes bacterium]|nr:hypothetical protein [Candidatus Hydrogenedentota bacterium]